MSEQRAAGGFEMFGYQTFVEHGFALPCYVHPGRTNATYVAYVGLPGDAKATIAGFEAYDSDDIQYLAPELRPSRVRPGDPWLDVFIWNKRVLVGTKAEIWKALEDERQSIAAQAPLSLLGLAEGVSPDAIRYAAQIAYSWLRHVQGDAWALRWLLDNYMRGIAVRTVRRRLGAEALSAATRRSLRDLVIHQNQHDLILYLPAEIERQTHLDVAAFRDISTVADALQLRLSDIRIIDTPDDKSQKLPLQDDPDTETDAEIVRRLVLAGQEIPASLRASVRELSLSGGDIDDISAVATLENLESLDLSYTSTADLNPLTRLSKLVSLDVGHTPVADLAPIAGITSLKKVIANSTLIDNVMPLSELVNLQELNVSETPVTMTEPLARLLKLRYLDLSGTQVGDLYPIGELVSLRALNINRTLVHDVTPVGNLRLLDRLELVATPVVDISALASLLRLRTLNLWATDVVDVTPLRRLTKLRFLDLWGTPVRDRSVLRHLRDCTIM
jgi:hypothetical protein